MAVDKIELDELVRLDGIAKELGCSIATAATLELQAEKIERLERLLEALAEGLAGQMDPAKCDVFWRGWRERGNEHDRADGPEAGQALRRAYRGRR
jgi:hypothetical protein